MTPFTSTPTNTPSTFSAAATIGKTYLNDPTGVIYAGSGDIWISDAGNGNLQLWSTVGSAPITTITTPSSPFQTAIDQNTGNLYVLEIGPGQISVLGPAGNLLTTFGSAQMSAGTPRGIAVNSSGTTVYGADATNGIVYAWAISGSPTAPTLTLAESFGSGILADPFGMNFDSQGYLWVADPAHARVAQFDYVGNYQAAITITGAQPDNVVPDNAGNLFVTDYNGSVDEVTLAGAAVTQYSDGFSTPFQTSFDPTYNYFWVADGGNGRVVELKKN